jgi:hypothetical protein
MCDNPSPFLYTRAPWQMQADVDVRAYDALAQHPRVADLAAIARSAMAAALQVKRLEHRPQQVAKLAAERGLSHEQAGTPFGNALDVLERGPEDDAERALAHALAASAFAAHPPADGDEGDRLAADVLWLGTHTHFDATALIDRALGHAAPRFWKAMADRVLRIDRGALPASGRGEALVGGVALASSDAPSAAEQTAILASQVRDRGLERVLTVRAAADADPLEPIVGEISPAPRGAVATALLGVTGVLLVLHAARLFGRAALAYKRPAQLTLLAHGVRVKWRVEILGHVLRDREVLLPRSGLLRAGREVRYPRLALYAGLLSLALGSYVGVSAFVDGARTASPSLLGLGILLVALGLALDFALTSVWPGTRGRCCISLVPRAGAPLSIGGVDTVRADALLNRLAGSS